MKLIVILSIFVLSAVRVYAEPEISAEYACVTVAETGEVVYGYNSVQKHSMASTTKIMTALVALNKCNTDECVKISRNAAYTEGSSAYLRYGETICMENLLYGLMLNSGNDAAVAIAEHIAGTESDFAEIMTQTAHDIGACNTSFKNASGLDDEEHYTTAEDLAKITAEALKNPLFRKIVSTSYKEAEYSGGILHFSNHNKLLKMYDGCIGVKTGFTKKTGRCLVSAAQRDGITLICVTLRANDDWNDHKKLLDYAFKKVSCEIIVEADKILKYIPAPGNRQISVVAAETVELPLTKGGRRKAELITHTVPQIDASVPEGEKIGECEVFYDGKLIKKIDLLSGEECIVEKSFLKSIIDFFKKPLKSFKYT